MGRKAKYSKEVKIEIVNRYNKGESSTSLANEFGLPKSGIHRIREWANKFNVRGESAFEPSRANKSYSEEFKFKVINDYLNGEGSLEYLSNKYGISTAAIVRDWVLKYNNGIEIKDYNLKSEVYAMKSRKTTFEERLDIVKYVLANDNDYKGAADKFTVPYASVYNWVKKYIERGEDGLRDRRGRPTNTTPAYELTVEEKQALEIERLKRELERTRMANEVLKKNIEIREKMRRDSHLLDKKISIKQ